MTEGRSLPAKPKPALPMVQQQRPAGLMINSIADAKELGALFVTAGLFEPSKREAEKGVTEEKKAAIATTKLIFGQALGLSPGASLQALHVMNGKIEMDYKLIGALIKERPGYDYKVLQSTNEIAEIEFIKDGVVVGVTKFDVDDMVRANLGGDLHAKYPRTMKFARCMHEGCNRYMPEILMGLGVGDGEHSITTEVEEVHDLAEAELEIEAIESGNVEVISSTCNEDGEVTELEVQAKKPTFDQVAAREAEIHRERGHEQLAEEKEQLSVATAVQRQDIMAAGKANGWETSQIAEYIRTDFVALTKVLRSQVAPICTFLKNHSYDQWLTSKKK